MITRRQLADFGLSADAIDRRLRAKRLLPLYRSVYVVGHQNRSRQTARMAAVLAGGRAAVLASRSAAALWALRRGSPLPIEVAVPRQRRVRHGIRFYVTPVPDDEVTVHDAIPVTTVPRPLFDLAAVLDERQLERAINEAEVLRLWDELSLHPQPSSGAEQAKRWKQLHPQRPRGDVPSLRRRGRPAATGDQRVRRGPRGGLRVARAAFERDRQKLLLARDVRRLLATATLAA